MTLEEMNKLIGEAANPDTAPGALASLKEGVETMIAQAEADKQAIAERDAKISEINTRRMEEFMRFTGTEGSAQTEEETEEEKQRKEIEAAQKEFAVQFGFERS